MKDKLALSADQRRLQEHTHTHTTLKTLSALYKLLKHCLKIETKLIID